MDVVDLLAELGGVARRGALLRVVTRKDLEAAVTTGAVVRDAHAGQQVRLEWLPEHTFVVEPSAPMSEEEEEE